MTAAELELLTRVLNSIRRLDDAFEDDNKIRPLSKSTEEFEKRGALAKAVGNCVGHANLLERTLKSQWLSITPTPNRVV